MRKQIKLWIWVKRLGGSDALELLWDWLHNVLVAQGHCYGEKNWETLGQNIVLCDSFVILARQ